MLWNLLLRIKVVHGVIFMTNLSTCKAGNRHREVRAKLLRGHCSVFVDYAPTFAKAILLLLPFPVVRVKLRLPTSSMMMRTMCL